MKKKIIYICISLLLCMSCDKKEDNVFSDSSDERLSATLQEYENILHSSPNGWLLSVDTKDGGGYRFWLSFNDKNRVTMLSDLDYTIKTAGETSKIPQESSYRLKALLAPSILFDTYNYLHILADPQKSVNEAADNATGLVSDFEFSFIKADNGRLYLRGNYNSRTAFMDPASPAEVECIAKGGLKTVFDRFNEYVNEVEFPVIQVGDTKLLTKPNMRKTDFAYMDDEENIVEQSIGSYIDLKALTNDVFTSDVHFFEPITILGETFEGMIWNEDKKCYVMQGTSKSYDVVDNEVPPYPLNFGVNQTFTKLYLDANTMQGTIPQKFMDQVYTPAYNSLLGNKRTMLYIECSFSENATSGKPQLNLWIRYQNAAGSGYTAKWYYPYEINDDGTLTFTDREQTGSSNERGQEPYLRKIADFFCTVEYSKYSTSSWAESVKSKVTPHTFRVDWAPNRTPGLTGNIGGLYRVDDEELYIAGQLSAK